MSGTFAAAETTTPPIRTRAPKPVCRTTIIGAGPYGLSVAAHLMAAGIETRAFGDVMSFWRGHMPAGMKLRSQWRASHFSAPGGRYSLNEFVTAGGLKFEEPIPLEDFIRYGEWFQRQAVPNLDSRKVSRVDRAGEHFRVILEDGETFESQRVVIAAGLANQAFVPREFQQVSRELVGHTANDVDLGRFQGRRVAVIGRGQSAMESAVLLAEAGAEVEVICRGAVNWLGRENAGMDGGRSALRGMVKRLRAPGGVGPFPLDWIAEMPGLLRSWPNGWRSRLSQRCLRPAAAGWLMPRMGGVRVNAGRAVTGVREQGRELQLHLNGGTRMTVDYVLLATGYRLDIAAPGILSRSLLDRVRLHPGAGCPVLGRNFESSVSGLHFAGSAAVPSYGPKMRFVAGVDYAARSITKGAFSRVR